MTPKPPKFFHVFIDSDGPVADFDYGMDRTGLPASKFKLEAGCYLYLPVTAGAQSALGKLKTFDDADQIRVWIATKTPSNSPYAHSEKVLWYKQHFPWLENRLVLTHDKSLLGTNKDFLLDDRPERANAQLFRGSFCVFDVLEPLTSWEKFVNTVANRLILDLDTSGEGSTEP